MPEREGQRSEVFVALLLFALVLIILQLWLVVATLENLIAGRPAMAIPAALTSIVILAINIWMLVGIFRMERRP